MSYTPNRVAPAEENFNVFSPEIAEILSSDVEEDISFENLYDDDYMGAQ